MSAPQDNARVSAGRLDGAEEFKLTSDYMPRADCPHERSVLLQLDCGAGGKQFRRYCLACWSSLGGAIAHAQVRAEIERSGVEPPLGDLELIRAAQDA